MTRSSDQAALAGARAEVFAIAEVFRRTAPSIVEADLRRRIEALLEARRVWADGLEPRARGALGQAIDEAITAGARDVDRRLAAEDVWLQPFTAPGIVHRPETGWDATLPEWIGGFLRRFTRRQDRPVLEDLDDPSNRVWVALLSAARPLDPVLEGFGLAPSDIPDLGGGHYGIQPRTAAQLDPGGELVRLWKRYRLAHERYAALSRSTR